MVALSLLASRAYAQSEPVALDTSACDGVDTEELRRILALERQVADAPGALQVALRCDQDHAWLHGGDTTRELELASVPEALRPRLLALAVAELRPPPPAQPAPPVVVAAAQRFRLFVAAYGQLSTLAAAGAQLGFSARVTPWIALTSGVTFTQGSLAIDRGDLRVRHASAHLGPSLQRELGLFTLAARLGVRAGWIGLRGLPDESRVRGQRFDVWFVGPSLFGSAAVRFSKHGFALLALEVTHTIREIHAVVRGGNETALSVWLPAASLGLGASW